MLTEQDILDYADQLDDLYFTDQLDDTDWDEMMLRFLDTYN